MELICLLSITKEAPVFRLETGLEYTDSCRHHCCGAVPFKMLYASAWVC